VEIPGETLVDLFGGRAIQQPDRLGYSFLPKGEDMTQCCANRTRTQLRKYSARSARKLTPRGRKCPPLVASSLAVARTPSDLLEFPLPADCFQIVFGLLLSCLCGLLGIGIRL
jgi:hypothetical protein